MNVLNNIINKKKNKKNNYLWRINVDKKCDCSKQDNNTTVTIQNKFVTSR